VATAGGNLALIVQTPDLVEPVGDHAALGAAITATLDDLAQGHGQMHEAARRVVGRLFQ
jgi:hypothetical protein